MFAPTDLNNCEKMRVYIYIYITYNKHYNARFMYIYFSKR